MRREGRETKTLRLVKRQAIAAKKEQEFHEKWKTCEGGASLMTQPPSSRWSSSFLGWPVQRFLSWRTRRLPAKDQESFGHLLSSSAYLRSVPCPAIDDQAGSFGIACLAMVWVTGHRRLPHQPWSSRIRCTLFLDSQTRTKGG